MKRLHLTLSTGAILLGLSTSGLLAADNATTRPADTSDGAAAVTTQETTKDGATLSHQDVQFLQKSAEKNLGSIVLGFLAIEKGASDEVKQHGRDLIDASVKANKELMELASKKNVFVPLNQLQLPNDHIDRLAEHPGEEFDRAFLALLVTEGGNTQGELRQASNTIGDSELKAFANSAASNLENWLKDVRKLNDDLGFDASSPQPVGEGPFESPQIRPDRVPQSGASPSPMMGEDLPLEDGMEVIEPQSQL